MFLAPPPKNQFLLPWGRWPPFKRHCLGRNISPLGLGRRGTKGKGSGKASQRSWYLAGVWRNEQLCQAEEGLSVISSPAGQREVCLPPRAESLWQPASTVVPVSFTSHSSLRSPSPTLNESSPARSIGHGRNDGMQLLKRGPKRLCATSALVS